MKQSLSNQEFITEEWQWARKQFFEMKRPLAEEDFALLKKHRKEWEIIYDTFSCEMCGQCCKLTKWVVNPRTRLIWEDIERWRREKRHDILRYVLVFEGLGGDLLDLKNQKFLPECPFLKRGENKKYVCTIHETKPFVCQVAPFFFYCRGICENCKAPIKESDVYCENCGMFLKSDPHFLRHGCPGLKKALKASGLYKPFRKYGLLEMIKMILLLK